MRNTTVHRAHKARKLSPAIQRAVERREAIERDFTPIEKLLVKTAVALKYVSRQIEDTEPEDTIFVIELNNAICERARAKRTGNPPAEVLVPLVERIYRMCVNQLAEPEMAEFDTGVLMGIATIIEEVMPGHANGADGYTGI
jgi:hypothetical protein